MVDKETKKIIAELCREAAHCIQLELEKRARRCEALDRALSDTLDWDAPHIRRLIDVNLRRAEVPDEDVEAIMNSVRDHIKGLFRDLGKGEGQSEAEKSLGRIGRLLNELADALSR